MALGLPFLPLWGALADRHARQPVIVRSYVVHLVAGVLALLAGYVWVFLLARALTGLALGNSGLMLATLAERVPTRRQGLAFALMNTAQPVGAFLGPLLGGPVVDAAGFPALLLLDLALLLLVVAALTVGYRDRFVGTARGPLLGMAAGSLRLLARTPRVPLLFLAMALLLAGWVLPYTYVPLAVAALYRGDEPGTAVGLVLGASGMTALAAGPLIGALADRWGFWRTLLIGAALDVALVPLPAVAPGLVSFGVGWALVSGVATGVYALTFNVLATSVASEARGRVMAFAYLPGNLAFIVGPALGSAVTGGTVFAAFPAAAGVSAAGLACLIVAARRGRAPLAAALARG
jgi:MFS family permease